MTTPSTTESTTTQTDSKNPTDQPEQQPEPKTREEVLIWLVTQFASMRGQIAQTANGDFYREGIVHRIDSAFDAAKAKLSELPDRAGE
jgi:hypothetical protein